MSLSEELPELMARCDRFSLTSRKKAARNLSQAGVFIVPDLTGQKAYPLHWLLYVRTGGASFSDAKSSNNSLKKLGPALKDAGYVKVQQADERFIQAWEAVIAACENLGTAPSNRSNAPNYHRRHFYIRNDDTGAREQSASTSENALQASQKQNKLFQEKVGLSRADSETARRKRLENAPPKPKRILTVSESFLRNPDVIAERLYLAAGNCQCCARPAPFSRAKDSTPFLEVHHIVPLSENGDDTVENTQALCPNCHREKHYG